MPPVSPWSPALRQCAGELHRGEPEEPLIMPSLEGALHRAAPGRVLCFDESRLCRRCGKCRMGFSVVWCCPSLMLYCIGCVLFIQCLVSSGISVYVLAPV